MCEWKTEKQKAFRVIKRSGWQQFMWRLVSRERRRFGRSICRFTWHNSTPDSGTIALEAPSTSLSPAEVIFPSLGGNNSKWAGLPAKGLREPTALTKVIDLNNVPITIYSFCFHLPRESYISEISYPRL